MKRNLSNNSRQSIQSRQSISSSYESKESREVKIQKKVNGFNRTFLNNEKKILSEIHDKLYNKTFEVCGNLQISEDDNLVYSYNKIDYNKQKKIKNSRASCQYEKYTKYIWHTHPNKIYPSIEDILQICKHDIIEHSYIINNEGFIKMIYIGETYIFNKDNKSIIQKILDNYYFHENTNKGRTFSKEAMRTLCKNLTKTINIIIYGDDYNIEKDKSILFNIKYYTFNI